MSTLSGKVAVITGGASGIGAATVRHFVEEGARVVVADVLDEEGNALARSLGDSAEYIHTDVTVESEVQAAIAHAPKRFGETGLRLQQRRIGRSRRADRGDLDYRLRPDDRCTLPRRVSRDQTRFAGARRAGEWLDHQHRVRRRSRGRLWAAHLQRRESRRDPPDPLRRLRARRERRPGQLHLSGGDGDGHLRPWRGALAGGRRAKLQFVTDIFANLQPLSRSGQPLDIARAAAWLASDESSFVTGHALVVDGGLLGGQKWSDCQAQAKQFMDALERIGKGE